MFLSFFAYELYQKIIPVNSALAIFACKHQSCTVFFYFRFTVGSETGRCQDIDSVIPFPTGWFKLTLTFSDPDDLKVYFDDTLAITLPPRCGGTFPHDDDEMLVFGRKYIDVNIPLV